MIRFLNFNTAYWGYLKTSEEAYECDNKVNAIIGQSGSGKTTLMDAIRMALGDARFENNRAMDHYINPSSNWAVVMVTFANGELEGYPFKLSGYTKACVTVCVRLDNSSGKVIREYYIFDGEFTDIIDVGVNPLHYRERKIGYEDYVKMLERAGISDVFKRLMMMRPEEIQNIVDLQPYQLFDKVFQLKGQKQIQEVHDDTEQKVMRLIEKEKQTLEDLREAERKLTEYEEKKIKYENYINTKEEYTKLDLLLKKRKYYDNENDIEESVKQKEISEKRLSQLIENQENDINELYEVENEKKRVQQEEEEIDNKKERQNEVVSKKCSDLAVLNSKSDEASKEIITLQGIEEESIDELIELIGDNDKLLSGVKYSKNTFVNRRDDINEKIYKLNNGYSPAPRYVDDYRSQLDKNNIKNIMIGDSISVKEAFSDWIYAIEGLLGGEKFRVIVSEENYLSAKRIQENCEYRYRVSLPKKLTKSFRKEQNINYSSILDAMDIENFDEVSGYLEKYKDIFLVDTVEDGHKLQKLGYKTLTKRGLLQDDDGSIFKKSEYLICGKIAREKYKGNLEYELETLNTEIDDLTKKENKLMELNENFSCRLENQKRRLELPKLISKYDQLQDEVKKVKNEEVYEKKKYFSLKALKDKLSDSVTELAVKYTKLEGELNNLISEINRVESSISGYKGELYKLNTAKINLINDLIDAGLDKDDINIIKYEATTEKIFNKNEEYEYTQQYLKDKVDELNEKIKVLEVECRGINQGTIAMVEPQKERVSGLRDESFRATEDRKEWEIRLDEAKKALRYHVRETMNEYIEEFNDMAELLGAKGLGKFEQEGEDYHNWKLIIKIGFDGKEAKPYYDPDLSKGQRAAVSIMLLLAAINNKNEEGRNSIMFLDEPTSRVDDYRAAEIGKILQKTNIQFFITHQVSASLQSVDWINNAIILSKLREGQTFADNPIIEYKRA